MRLTAFLRLLVTAVLAVILVVALPVFRYAAVVGALELRARTGPWLCNTRPSLKLYPLQNNEAGTNLISSEPSLS